MNPDAFKNHTRKPVTRPGITAATLDANGVRRVGPSEAESLCGLAVSGLWIPYRALDGAPIREENREFGRLRLVAETDGKRYHSRAGSRSHLYQPARLAELVSQLGCTTLYLCEGEFKAMSACEHGIPAAGVSGIGNAAPQGRLVDELQLLVSDSSFSDVIFVADSDAGIIADFSRAMTKLAHALPDDVDLSVIAPGLDAPAKGIDDTREKLGEGFAAYWEELTGKAVAVARGTAWEELAFTLLRRESPAAIAAIVNGQAHEEAA